MAAGLLRQAGGASWLAKWDGLLVTLAFVHGGLLLAWPSGPLIAVSLWWNANTISHNFIHRPFFRTRAMNRVFSCCLTLMLGFPQSLWRARHLAHHGVQGTQRLATEPLDVLAVLGLWGGLFGFAPKFALAVYLPGFLAGLGLCYLQGHYEHAQRTVSHYGWLYNLLTFNDGYHVEHHLRPGIHWLELPRTRTIDASSSRWPAVLRWLECANLCALERLVLRFSVLQRFVIERHEGAVRRLLHELPPVQRAGIVGGGLFPRTAIILARLIPEARLAIIEMNPDNIGVSRRFVGNGVEYISKRFEPEARSDFDLLVIPLAFVGDRESIYRHPPASTVLVHDWIWRPRGSSVIVSWLLLKRINLVKS